MAEAIAVLSLVATIAQLVDFGTKVVDRLDEFTSNMRETPKVFRGIQNQLPLILETLKETQRQSNNSYISKAAEISLKPLVADCLAEVKSLNDILDKTVPSEQSSNWQKRLRSLKSLARDKEVERITLELERHIQVLMFHQTTATRSTIDNLLSQNQSERSTEFIASLSGPGGRDDLFEIKEACENTCNWIWVHPKYQSWKQGTGNHILHIVGKPGTGKSVLAKHVLEDLEKESEGKDDCDVFYYFVTIASGKTRQGVIF